MKPRESSFPDFGKEASDDRTLRGFSHDALRDSCPQLSGQTDLDSKDSDCNDQQVWKDTSRPTHFLALRITNEEIVRMVGQVQAHMLKIQPLYSPCCIPSSALHITLCTLGLDTPDQVAHAVEVLHRIQPQLATSLPHTPLRVDGVDTFFNRVVYAKVQQQPEFMEFVDHLKLLLWESGVEMRDVHHGYTPHVTIMKATKPLVNQKGTKDVDPSLYKDYTDMYFGQQTLDRVYLCTMGGSKREDGFYECLGEIEFGQA
ncbi:LOW QUALITY PROTEIN: A-kinase anchor protein 7-like [Pomacea canaliculata]|uniref:LOW QUALITY PROTEIN: A-kinase anchor protein 7-like n=1 Tax=Pomacea canaliculata TaxID=400727 RepID=UPI000D73967D|nr:LOW QUALITY PROTEIN: A-kinase anchor protein 7-like [Pomacea canaliculata]